MPPLLLTQAEIEVVCKRRKRACNFAKSYGGVIGHDLSDAKIARHME